MQNLRLILGAEEMWDRLKASVWVRFHAFFSFDGLPAILVFGCFLIATLHGHFLIRLYFASIFFYKIFNSLRTSTATLIFLKTFVAGHTTWQRVIRGPFSLQAPGLATLKPALMLCLVRWLIPKQGRESWWGFLHVNSMNDYCTAIMSCKGCAELNFFHGNFQMLYCMVHDLFIGLWPLALNYTNCPLEIALNQTLWIQWDCEG